MQPDAGRRSQGLTIARAIFPGRRGIFPAIEPADAGSMRKRLYGSTFAPNLLLAPHMHSVGVPETARQAESGDPPALPPSFRRPLGEVTDPGNPYCRGIAAHRRAYGNL